MNYERTISEFLYVCLVAQLAVFECHTVHPREITGHPNTGNMKSCAHSRLTCWCWQCLPHVEEALNTNRSVASTFECLNCIKTVSSLLFFLGYRHHCRKCVNCLALPLYTVFFLTFCVLKAVPCFKSIRHLALVWFYRQLSAVQVSKEHVTFQVPVKGPLRFGRKLVVATWSARIWANRHLHRLLQPSQGWWHAPSTKPRPSSMHGNNASRYSGIHCTTDPIPTIRCQDQSRRLSSAPQRSQPS